jgi:hypothetical protein
MTTSCSYLSPATVIEPNRVSSILGFTPRLMRHAIHPA